MGVLREGKTMKIYINNIDLSLFGFYLITTRDDAFEFSFGLKQSANESNTNSFRPPQINGIKMECISFNFTLTKLTPITEIPLPMTDYDLDWLSRLLYKQDEMISIECNGKMCEGYVTDSTESWLNTYNMGYINVNFKTTSPYFYSPIITDERLILDSYLIDVYNKSNVNDYVYPNFIIKNNKATKITIKNSNGKSMIINNLKPNTTYEVLNERKIVRNSADYTDNVYSNISGDWIDLRYGKNTFNITVNGKLDFKVEHRNKYSIT